MVRFLFCLTAVGVASLSAYGQGYDVRADKSLAEPVTLSVKYGAIDAVLKSIGKQIHTDLEVSTPVNTDKVTVFVKDVPANVVLDRIASVLGAQWKNLSGVRFLSMDDAHQKALSDYLAAEDIALRAKAEEDVAAILQRLKNERESSDENADNDPDAVRSTPIRRQGLAMNRSAMADQIGRILENASSSDMEEFWKGEIASVEVGPGETQPARTPGLRRRMVPRIPTDPSVIFARYDYYGNHSIEIGSSLMPINTLRYDIPAQTHPEGTLADTKFGKSVQEWSSLDPGDSADAFKAPIQGGAPAQKFGFGVVNGGQTQQQPEGMEPVLTTQSDYLEKFFKISGIPVVADGFRTSLPQRSQEPSGGTSLDWLKSLQEQTGAFVQIKDGVASVRQGGFWRLNQYEIPESDIATLEASTTKPGLVEYANFFAGLSPSQVAAFRSDTPPKLKFSTSGLADQIPALQFIATLGPSFPVDGKSVPISELGGDSEKLAFKAISYSVFSGELWNKDDAGTVPKSILVSLQAADVQQPEGTVPGIILKFNLPMGQTVSYQIPLKLGNS